MTKERRPPTLTVPLPGGQSRIREAILYVAERGAGMRFFGAIKLNKIIWRADFRSFADRGVPLTGREYRRRYFGPALLEMLPVHREMLKDGLIRMERRDFGDGIVENRTIPLVKPNSATFSQEDLAFLDESIEYFRHMTGDETSDDSHGVAWKTRNDGDPMPYDLAYLSDKPLSLPQLLHIEQLIYEKGWISE